jgi:hypothetical protein
MDLMFLKMCGFMKFGVMGETDNSHKFIEFTRSLFSKAVRNSLSLSLSRCGLIFKVLSHIWLEELREFELGTSQIEVRNVMASANLFDEFRVIKRSMEYMINLDTKNFA